MLKKNILQDDIELTENLEAQKYTKYSYKELSKLKLVDVFGIKTNTRDKYLIQIADEEKLKKEFEEVYKAQNIEFDKERLALFAEKNDMYSLMKKILNEKNFMNKENKVDGFKNGFAFAFSNIMSFNLNEEYKKSVNEMLEKKDYNFDNGLYNVMKKIEENFVKFYEELETETMKGKLDFDYTDKNGLRKIKGVDFVVGKGYRKGVNTVVIDYFVDQKVNNLYEKLKALQLNGTGFSRRMIDVVFNEMKDNITFDIDKNVENSQEITKEEAQKMWCYNLLNRYNKTNSEKRKKLILKELYLIKSNEDMFLVGNERPFEKLFKDFFEENKKNIPLSEEELKFLAHKLKKNETLTNIETNNLQNHLLNKMVEDEKYIDLSIIYNIGNTKKRAKFFEDKIKTATEEKVLIPKEKNTNFKKFFNKVELDGDVKFKGNLKDEEKAYKKLTAFETLEREIVAFDKLFEKVMPKKDVTLRFRKIDKKNASGIYYFNKKNNEKNIIINVKNNDNVYHFNSFMHELGHYIDYNYNQVIKNGEILIKSRSEEFKKVKDIFRSKLDDVIKEEKNKLKKINGGILSKKIVSSFEHQKEYLSKGKEIFANSFNFYLKENGLVSNFTGISVDNKTIKEKVFNSLNETEKKIIIDTMENIVGLKDLIPEINSNIEKIHKEIKLENERLEQKYEKSQKEELIETKEETIDTVQKENSIIVKVFEQKEGNNNEIKETFETMDKVTFANKIKNILINQESNANKVEIKETTKNILREYDFSNYSLDKFKEILNLGVGDRDFNRKEDEEILDIMYNPKYEGELYEGKEFRKFSKDKGMEFADYLKVIRDTKEEIELEKVNMPIVIPLNFDLTSLNREFVNLELEEIIGAENKTAPNTQYVKELRDILSRNFIENIPKLYISANISLKELNEIMNDKTNIKIKDLNVVFDSNRMMNEDVEKITLDKELILNKEDFDLKNIILFDERKFLYGKTFENSNFELTNDEKHYINKMTTTSKDVYYYKNSKDILNGREVKPFNDKKYDNGERYRAKLF